MRREVARRVVWPEKNKNGVKSSPTVTQSGWELVNFSLVECKLYELIAGKREDVALRGFQGRILRAEAR